MRVTNLMEDDASLERENPRLGTREVPCPPLTTCANLPLGNPDNPDIYASPAPLTLPIASDTFKVSLASLEDALDNLEEEEALEDWHHYWLEEDMRRGNCP